MTHRLWDIFTLSTRYILENKKGPREDVSVSSDVVKPYFCDVNQRSKNHVLNRLRTELLYNSYCICRETLSNQTAKEGRTSLRYKFKSKNDSFILQIFIDYLLCDRHCYVS